MSEGAEATGGDATVTFKVKTSADGNHSITMAESATVLDLKTKLAGEDYENIPVERQRLIYSGRVMKNDDTLATYKIKPNNTIHMVKSAASNPGQPASSSAQTAPQAVPTNMASGTANNPLAGLTGARYAGQGLNMPGLDMFGPDGGMGPPMDEEALARMMADPNAQQALNEVLNNPDVVNHLIESNPMLRNVPNAREIIQSPFMRQMMTNPQMMTQMMRMRRNMAGGGGGGAFPAPGATDNTPADGSAATGDANATGNANAQANPFMNPFMMMPGMGGLGGGEGGQDGGLMNMLAQMQAAQTQSFQAQRAQGGAAAGEAATGTTTSPGAGATTGTQDSSTPGQGGAQNQPPANPFAALFGAPGAGAAGAGAGAGANPFGMTPEMMQSMLQMMGGGGGGAPAGPPDNRPPEERYADQLRQLNDMGFFDFDRNVAALRRSGGSVQGAIEHLLNATD